MVIGLESMGILRLSLMSGMQKYLADKKDLHSELHMGWWVLQISQAHLQGFPIKPKKDMINPLLLSNPQLLNFPLEKKYAWALSFFFKINILIDP